MHVIVIQYVHLDVYIKFVVATCKRERCNDQASLRECTCKYMRDKSLNIKFRARYLSLAQAKSKKYVSVALKVVSNGNRDSKPYS